MSQPSVYQHNGQTIYRTTLPPPLLTAMPAKQICLLTSRETELIRIRKHWDVNLSATVPCQCEPRCHSSREECYAAGLLWIGNNEWEERLVRLTEQAESSLRLVMAQKSKPNFYRGAWFAMQRSGGSEHSRVIIDWRGWITEPPDPFDVGYAVQKRLGISAQFFGVESTDQVVTPARARTDTSKKPRMPLGKKQG